MFPFKPGNSALGSIVFSIFVNTVLLAIYVAIIAGVWRVVSW